MNATLKITLGTLAAAVLLGGGVMAGRHWAKDTSELASGPDGIRARTVAGTGVASQRTRQVRYRATTRFRINQSSAPDVFSGAVPRETRDLLAGDWFEKQVKALSSRSTLTLAAKNLKLGTEWKRSPHDAATRLAGMIEVEQEPNAGIVSLSAWSDKAEEATAIANGVRDAYEQQRREAEAERVRRLSKNVSSQITLQEAAVEKSRLEMMELMKKHNIADLAPFNSAGIQQPAEALAANLLYTAEIEETPEAPPETDPAVVVAERQKQSDYGTAKHRYESQLHLLIAIRDHAEKPRTDESVIGNPIEILEPAVAVEDP